VLVAQNPSRVKATECRLIGPVPGSSSKDKYGVAAGEHATFALVSDLTYDKRMHLLGIIVLDLPQQCETIQASLDMDTGVSRHWQGLVVSWTGKSAQCHTCRTSAQSCSCATRL
jgi:hypothetical protein